MFIWRPLNMSDISYAQNNQKKPGTVKAEVQSPVKTTIKALGFLGVSGGAPCAVDYRDGKVIRIRPLHYDWMYTRKELNPWKYETRGKVLEPTFKSNPGPFSLAYKKRAYSPNRIKYPLIRVDWDPKGERNPQNRGKSKYRRISWDEAARIVSSEIKRVQEKIRSICCYGTGRWSWGVQIGTCCPRSINSAPG